MPLLHVRALAITLQCHQPVHVAMSRYFSLIIVASFLFVGCRDTISGLQDPLVDPEAPPTAEVGSIYIKGPANLQEGSSDRYRAELTEGVADYIWTVYGQGAVTLSPTGDLPQNRLIEMVTRQSGEIILIARAYNREGVLLGYGRKLIEIISP